MEKKKKENIKSLTRRKFLADSALMASAFTILPRYVMGGPGYVPPSDKLNIGCVGIGGKGKEDLAGVSSENIIALCDVDDVRAKEAYAAYPKARKYKDFREMLDKEKDIDAVTISTPDHVHAIATITAMKLGKHVYTQKPLTRTIAESRRVVDLARKVGVATQMGNQGHANEGPRILNELIWQGSIGKVKKAHCWTDRPIWPQGIVQRPDKQVAIPSTLNWDLWVGPSAYRPYAPEYVPFNWRGWWDFGCGALGDMGCHIMDYPFWALKLQAPITVEAYSSPVFQESPPLASMITYTFKTGLDDSLVEVIWYDGGLKPNIPEGLTSEVSLWKSGSGVMFEGESGTIVYGHHRPKPILVINKREKDYGTPQKMIPRSPGHYIEWLNECKGSKERAMSNFDYAGPMTETVLLGNVALRAGKKLYWDPVNMRVTNMPEADQYLRMEYRNGWDIDT